MARFELREGCSIVNDAGEQTARVGTVPVEIERRRQGPLRPFVKVIEPNALGASLVPHALAFTASARIERRNGTLAHRQQLLQPLLQLHQCRRLDRRKILFPLPDHPRPAQDIERFQLALAFQQLRQLRGRVGRRAEQSFCLLMTSARLGEEAFQRIRTMVATNDGFRIAEADLRLRGAGDLEGTQQSGLPEMKIANLAADQEILRLARDAAKKILDGDPELVLPDHTVLRTFFEERAKTHSDWSRVS